MLRDTVYDYIPTLISLLHKCHISFVIVEDKGQGLRFRVLIKNYKSKKEVYFNNLMNIGQKCRSTWADLNIREINLISIRQYL